VLIQVDSLRYTVKPVYKGHSKEPEKSAGALYIQVKYTVNLYIKTTQRNLQMWPLSAGALYIQVKIICTIH
jgi:hypothetical protein